MKRQKRNRFERAEKQGYQAGINKRTSDECPYQVVTFREQWLSGWRKAREHLNLGWVH
ncbi:MAG: ribosome modulation factor [Gammaproteobacteria bacterium CG22_combo_CG10-13_8_21_14_all_40_8]|nr:MAG: ribosome modulation factor [Gammaproteobacteria bacterium CG22_combo_CG10-13_8_21_14_all_40_8]